MKKTIYMALVCLMTGVSSVFAQTGTIVFTDGNGGAVLEDGATIVRTHLTEDIYMGNYIHSGLFVKNTAESGGQNMAISQTIDELPSGSGAQLCFNDQCKTYYTAGTIETAIGPLVAGASADLQAEWFVPNNYSQCKVTYQIKYKNLTGFDSDNQPIFENAGDGPRITVIYNYADPAGIDAVETEKDVRMVEYFSVLGQKMAVGKGLCIKRTTYADGTKKCVKVVIK